MRCVTTLTGFKWIARAGGPDGALVYGYEQALGYAVRPDLVADKDGISAALLVLQPGGGGGQPKAGPWPTGSTTSRWPTACTSPGSGRCGRTARPALPGWPTRSNGSGRSRRACWPGSRSR